MLRKQCPGCRCFRTNINSPEIKDLMTAKGELCFAGEDPYIPDDDCEMFSALGEPLGTYKGETIEGVQ